MDTTSDDAPPARRPTSLDDLPRELKALVAAMVSTQDDGYNARIAACTPKELEGLPSSGDWDGRSLSSLRLVNREWSSLADVEVFEELIPRRCSEDIFTFDIVRCYGSLVKRVFFGNEDTRENCISLLRSLPHFKNLQRMIIEHDAFVSLFGDGSEAPPTDQQTRFRKALAASVATVEHLDIPSLSPKALGWALPAINRLRSLELEFSSQGHSRAAVEAIAELKGLRNLELHSLDTEAAAALEEVAKSGCWHSTSLESLVLSSKYDAFAGGIWTFTEQFSTTLTTLRLIITNLASELPSFVEFVKDRNPTFPHLRRLSLSGAPDAISSQLSLFKHSPIVNVNLYLTLTSQSLSSSDAAAATATCKTLARFPRLHLVIHSDSIHYTPPSLASRFTLLATECGISLAILRPSALRRLLPSPGWRPRRSRRWSPAEENGASLRRN